MTGAPGPALPLRAQGPQGSRMSGFGSKMGSGSWIRAWLVPNRRAAQCWSQWQRGLMGIDSHHGLWAGPQQEAAGQGPWSLGLLMLVGLGCQRLPS